MAYKPVPINVFIKEKIQTIVTATEKPQINKHLKTRIQCSTAFLCGFKQYVLKY